jgi:hypothetical protein
MSCWDGAAGLNRTALPERSCSRSPLVRRNISLIAAGVVVLVGTGLTAVPISAFGIDQGSFSAMEAILATLVATILTWNALR